MTLSLSDPIHRAGRAYWSVPLHVTCLSHSKCSVNRCADGRSRPTVFQEAQNKQLNLHAVSQVQRIAVLLSQREHGPCETPSPLIGQVMILLSEELTPSEAGTSFIHGTKAENVDCSIHRSCPLTLPLSSPEDTWQGTRSAGTGAPLSLQTEREHSGSLEGCQVGSQSPLSSTLKLTRCLKSSSSRYLLSHRPDRVLAWPKVPPWRKWRQGWDPNARHWVQCSNRTTSRVLSKAAAVGPFLSPVLSDPPQLEPPTSSQASLYAVLGLNPEQAGSR